MAQPPTESHESAQPPQEASVLIAARREKLRKWREELGIDPYGQRVDGLIMLAEARAMLETEAAAELL